MSPGRRGPSAVWYGVAGVLAVAAIAIGVVLIVVGIVEYDDRIEDFQRVPAPGSGTLTFLDDGGYTAYFELPYDCEAPCAPDLAIHLEPIDGVTSGGVEVDDYDGTFTYDNEGRHGEAVATLDIPEPGRYRIQVSDVTESGVRGRLAVGRSVGKVILYGFLAGFAVIAVGVFLAGMLILFVGLRRVRAKDALATDYR